MIMAGPAGADSARLLARSLDLPSGSTRAGREPTAYFLGVSLP